MKPLRGMFLAVAFVGLSSSIETATAHSPNWTGLYFGGHAGFASSDVDWTFFNGALEQLHHPLAGVAQLHEGHAAVEDLVVVSATKDKQMKTAS